MDPSVGARQDLPVEDRLLAALTTFNNNQQSRQPEDASSHSLSQVPSAPPITPLSWAEDPTNPVNRPSQSPSQYSGPTQSQWATDLGLDQDDSIITPIRYALELRRARIAAIESLPGMLYEQKINLRNLLGYDNWPTHLQTYENLHAPPFKKDGRPAAAWSEKDERVLRLIVLHGPHEVADGAPVFFPERSSEDVSTKINQIFPTNDGQNQGSELTPTSLERDVLGVEAVLEV